MTEQEWLARTDPTQMLAFLRWTPMMCGKSDRKMLLFACACCSAIEDAIIDKCSRDALETARRFAEGNATKEALDVARDAAWKAKHHLVAAKAAVTEISAASAAAYAAAFPACRYASDAADNAAFASPTVAYDGPEGHFMAAVDAAKRTQVVLLRDVIGNPYQPVAIRPEWFTPSVVSLARHIYDHDSFADLPRLGDALAAIGCDDEVILGHCREPTGHVRGCWVIDAMLGNK